MKPDRILLAFQHTAARRRLLRLGHLALVESLFQHTAARRRLPLVGGLWNLFTGVSTHSRAEAAAHPIISGRVFYWSFNTQPRGGGCINMSDYGLMTMRFNTQPRGGGCRALFFVRVLQGVFQHTAARRRLHGTRFYRQNRQKFQHTAARRRLQF